MFKGLGTDTLDILTYLIVGSLIVLIITHPTGFASAVTSLGGLIQGESKILTGA
jgi:hypothetical protein